MKQMEEERLARVREMEDRLNRLITWLETDPAPAACVRADAAALDAYYRSGLWRDDYEADERGELPSGLPRGVLSEDALYNALTEYEERTEEVDLHAGGGFMPGKEPAKPVVADVTQTFYDSLASQYDQFYLDWQTTTREEAEFLSGIFRDHGFDHTARILDCACGIGTQAIGLAALGYPVTASDISAGEIEEAKRRAQDNSVSVCFRQADFRALSDVFSEQFDIVIAMDNALPHMLSGAELERAVKSIAGQIRGGGLFVASIRDYDLMLKEKPAFSAPYIHKTEKGQRVLFQTWDWAGENYRFIQYIIEDEETARVSRFECEYRATRRGEITELLYANGCQKVDWVFPEETGFYQPVVIARK